MKACRPGAKLAASPISDIVAGPCAVRPAGQRFCNRVTQAHQWKEQMEGADTVVTLECIEPGILVRIAWISATTGSSKIGTLMGRKGEPYGLPKSRVGCVISAMDHWPFLFRFNSRGARFRILTRFGRKDKKIGDSKMPRSQRIFLSSILFRRPEGRYCGGFRWSGTRGPWAAARRAWRPRRTIPGCSPRRATNGPHRRCASQ